MEISESLFKSIAFFRGPLAGSAAELKFEEELPLRLGEAAKEGRICCEHFEDLSRKAVARSPETLRWLVKKYGGDLAPQEKEALIRLVSDRREKRYPHLPAIIALHVPLAREQYDELLKATVDQLKAAADDQLMRMDSLDWAASALLETDSQLVASFPAFDPCDFPLLRFYKAAFHRKRNANLIPSRKMYIAAERSLGDILAFLALYNDAFGSSTIATLFEAKFGTTEARRWRRLFKQYLSRRERGYVDFL